MMLVSQMWFIPTEYKLGGNKLQDTSNLHITSLLLCNGYLWIGTSAGAIMVYRTPYLKTVPITTGKPYMALHGHTSGVRVLISTQTAGTLSSSRFDQFVSEEQRRFQEEWEPVEPEEGPHVNGEDIVSATGVGETGSLPREEAEDSSTFPPLPPPNFDDLSPTGTLKAAEREANGGTETASDKQSRSSTPKAHPEASEEHSAETSDNAHTADSETAHATTTSTLPQASPNSSDSQEINDAIDMPMRRRSSNRSSQRSDGSMGGEGRDTFSRGASAETQDTGTFRRLNTLEATGKKRPSPVDEGGESEPTPPPREIPQETPPPLYDEVTPEDSPSLNRKRSPSPYEDPTTLHLTGPAPLHPMPDFFTTLEQSVTTTSHSSGCTEGAIYVLTGGRGFANLQPGKLKSSQYISVSTANESCIIAYELKH